MRLACLVLGLLAAASSDAEVHYRVPWPDGLTFMLTQVSDGRVTSHFTKARLHAVDIGMPPGTPVLAARDGVVEALEERHGASADEEPLSYEGNFVRVRHDDGTAAIYAHLAHRSIVVGIGGSVQAGQLLGLSGASGDVTEPHLHFAVTRLEQNSSGWREEVSLPVKFYIGVPQVVFAPRAALIVKADYTGAVDPPRTPSEGTPAPWKPRVLGPWEEAGAWCLLAAWIACAVAGMSWFWRFSRE